MCEAEPHILNARMLAVERKRFSVIRRTVGLAVLYMVYRNSGNWVTDMIFHPISPAAGVPKVRRKFLFA